MCYQDFNSKILRLSFSLTSFSLSTSSAIPPRLSHRQLPPLYVQTELKCPWPLRPSLWCGLVWIWQHFEWLCYSVPLFFSSGLLVCCDDERLMTEEELLQFKARNQNFFFQQLFHKITRSSKSEWKMGWSNIKSKLQVGHLQHNGHPAPSLPWTSWSLSAPFLFCTSQWFPQPAPSSPWQPESNLYQFFCDIKLAVIPHQLSEAFKLQLAKIRFYKYRQCRPTCIA